MLAEHFEMLVEMRGRHGQQLRIRRQLGDAVIEEDQRQIVLVRRRKPYNAGYRAILECNP